MPTQNVSLTEKQAKFVRQSVNEGEFRNASEVVRAGLRLLEQEKQAQKMKLKMMRKMIKEGFDQIDRGEYIDVDDVDLFMDAVCARVKKKVK